MFAIYAPGKTALNVADAGTAAAMLSSPQIQDYLPDAVVSQASQRGYIVNGIHNARCPDLADISVTIVDGSGDLECDSHRLAVAHDIIGTWARRSRVPGVSGDRVAVVGPLEKESNPDIDLFTSEIRVGTAVFFNDRRVTVNFAGDKHAFTQDLKNLFDHLGRADLISDDCGVIVKHDEFGEFHSGNTDIPVPRFSQVSHSHRAGFSAPAPAAAPVRPAAPAPAPAPVYARAPVAPPAAPAQVALTDAQLESALVSLRMQGVSLSGINRDALKVSLITLLSEGTKLLEALEA